MTVIDEILKKIGYNDGPLRREVKTAFAEWLQQESKTTFKQNNWAQTVIYKLLEKLR